MDKQNSVNERSGRISRLLSNQKSRTAYIKAKLAVLVPAQIRALRLKSTNPPMPFQRDLARESEIKQQSRISMLETPGAANITLETLAKIAAGLRVGVIIKFVPFSDMLRWENSFSPEDDVIRLERDYKFLTPDAFHAEDAQAIAGAAESGGNVAAESKRKPMAREWAASAVESVGAI
ncbi:MAG TPA: helix-turn-helix transcriptional regulator [Terracidiphilus sp.]|nr:helix-turn-helix transcriptional regulator [Terracidiphilus sp.]